MPERGHREQLGGPLERGEEDDEASAHGRRAYQRSGDEEVRSGRACGDDQPMVKRRQDGSDPALLPAATPAVGPLPVAGPPLRRWPPPALLVRAFRWYWIAQWPTLLGTWMQVVALGYLVFDLTHSSTAVAAVAAADGLPAVVLSLGGGLLADRLPRRRILLVTQSVLGVSSGALAVLALTGPRRLLVHHRGRRRLRLGRLPRPAHAPGDGRRPGQRDLIVNAVALSSTAMSATRIIGPSLAGLLIATAGPGRLFRGAVGRLHRATGSAPHGHPRRTAPAARRRRHRAGGAPRGCAHGASRPTGARHRHRVRRAGVLRRLLHAVPASPGHERSCTAAPLCSAFSTPSAASAASSAAW